MFRRANKPLKYFLEHLNTKLSCQCVLSPLTDGGEIYIKQPFGTKWRGSHALFRWVSLCLFWLFQLKATSLLLLRHKSLSYLINTNKIQIPKNQPTEQCYSPLDKRNNFNINSSSCSSFFWVFFYRTSNHMSRSKS